MLSATHDKCLEWKNVLDFPDLYGWEISRFYLANYCKRCEVWYPAGSVGKFCPCCRGHVRFRSPKFPLTNELRQIYAKRMQEFKARYPDWTLVRKEIMKPIIDLNIKRGII